MVQGQSLLIEGGRDALLVLVLWELNAGIRQGEWGGTGQKAVTGEPGVGTEGLPTAVLPSWLWTHRGRKVNWQGRGRSPQWVSAEFWKLPREWGLKIDTEVDSRQLHLDILVHCSPSRNICLSELHPSTVTKHCPKAHEGRRGLVSSYRLQPISEGSQHGHKQEFGAETWGRSHGGTLLGGLLRLMPS